VLTTLTSAPVLSSATTLSFTVHPALPPASQTNYIAGITDNGNDSCTIEFIGTMGASYYVQTTTNLLPPIQWQAMVGSTNTVTNLAGLWNLTVTNSGQQQFYRAVAVNQ
jgi:hypothetical protein